METATLAAADAETINLQELNQATVCEQIRRPGSRLIVSNRCFTPDASPGDEIRRQQMVRQQMDDLRRDQEAQERLALERERELARQRARMLYSTR